MDKNSKWPAGIQRFVQASIQAKTPGWESQKTPYVDAWGRESTASSKLLGAFENFFTPWYRSVKNTTDVDDELQRLYDATGESVLPSAPKTSTKIGGRDLSADEYVALAKDAGSTKYTLLSQLVYDPRYLALSDAEKALAVQKIYEYASATSKYHVDDSYYISTKWMREAESAGSMALTYNRIWEAIDAAIEKQK